jgi:RNA polymerase sigma-70 factor, ECF subfamily
LGKTQASTLNIMSDKKKDFENVVLPHLSYLYRVTFSLVRGHKEDREDLVQETIIKAYKSFHQLNHNEKCRAWLTSILYNTFINKYRREKENPMMLQSVEETLVYQEDPEKKILEKATYEELLKALSELPEEYRTVIIFSDMQDLSYKDITEILGVPIGTVRSRLSRGRQLLREKLHESSKEGVSLK